MPLNSIRQNAIFPLSSGVFFIFNSLLHSSCQIIYYHGLVGLHNRRGIRTAMSFIQKPVYIIPKAFYIRNLHTSTVQFQLTEIHLVLEGRATRHTRLSHSISRQSIWKSFPPVTNQ